jgi:hypothetical protein
MDAREQRGLAIAALCRLNHQKFGWLVPSQSSADTQYLVDPERGTCTCPDHKEHGHACKHVHAVRFTLKREMNKDGTITESKTLTFVEEKTYTQNWPVYDKAQMVERDRFLELLHDLCKGVPDYPQPKTGRRHAPFCDMIFAAEPLVEKTAKNFDVQEVPADKAYLSHENLELVASMGGTAYIPFKSNNLQGEAGTIWEKMYLFYNFKREEFAKHYHLRSLAESAFSALKAKFGDSVRSKTTVAMKNEVLAKCLAFNICVLIHSQLELGIEPVFWQDETANEKAILPMTNRA